MTMTTTTTIGTGAGGEIPEAVGGMVVGEAPGGEGFLTGMYGWGSEMEEAVTGLDSIGGAHHLVLHHERPSHPGSQAVGEEEEEEEEEETAED